MTCNEKINESNRLVLLFDWWEASEQETIKLFLNEKKRDQHKTLIYDLLYY